MHLSIVTWNTWKFQQISDCLPDFVDVEQVNLDLPEIQTNLLTEISADKAMQAFSKLQHPILVDDSGIYFDAFDHFPGALTKFLYTWVGMEGIRNLFTNIEKRNATFQCVLTYMDETLDSPVQFIGETTGTISFDRLGKIEEDPKLPYDLIFVPTWMDAPAITDMHRRKTEFNHRVKAARKFSEYLTCNVK